MRRLPFLLIVVASLGGLCGPRGGPPAPDACDHPSTAGVDGLEIGTGTGDPFLPIHDDDVIQPVYGPQGGTMIPIRLRLSGAATPGCVVQSTVFTRDAMEVAHESTSLKTYAQPDGGFLTKPDYVVFFEYVSPGDLVTITVDAGGQQATRRIWIIMPGDLGRTD